MISTLSRSKKFYASLLKPSLLYSIKVSLPTQFRCFSAPGTDHSNDFITSPNKVVFISQSTDIFSNLAFEGWLYKNCTFNDRHLLFLWRNSPCVVIGRHQNPFKEANLSYLDSAGVPLARRQSGGGAVYHDMGNLNCTFFTPRERSY